MQKQPQEVFCKKDVLRNFTKFTGKHLCQSLFLNKVADLRCFPVNVAKFLRAPFLQNTSASYYMITTQKLFNEVWIYTSTPPWWGSLSTKKFPPSRSRGELKWALQPQLSGQHISSTVMSRTESILIRQD